ncbi:MAG: hypothetical protein ACRCYU_09575 [Nocardioides sp.]
MGRPIIWLAWRVTMRRRNLPLAAVITVGITLLTLLALATAMVPGAAKREQSRLQAITPIVNQGDGGKDSVTARIVDPRLTNTRRWQGNQIIRYYYASANSASAGPGPRVPGIPKVPDVGQFYASPALISLIQREEDIAALFTGRKLAGVIGGAGLGHPHELRAIVGVPADSYLLQEVTGYGRSPGQISQEEVAGNRTVNTVVATFGGILIWLPAIWFLQILARLANAQRMRRTRALRALGLSRAGVRTLHWLELGVLCVLAIVIGAATYAWVVRHLTRIPGTSIGFCSGDLQLALWLLIGCLIGPTVGALVVTSVAVDSVGGRSSATVSSLRTRATELGLVALTLGLVLLFVAPHGPRGVVAALALWMGCALVAAGLGLAGPWLVIAIFTHWVRRARSAGRVVGMKLAISNSPTSLRLSSLLGIMILLLLGFQAFINILNGGSSADWQARLAAVPQVPAVANLAGDLSLAELQARTPGVTSVMQRQITTESKERLRIVYADCQDLRNLTNTVIRGCTGQPQWLNAPTAIAGNDDQVMLARGREVRLPGTTDVAVAPGAPARFAGSLLVPAGWAPEQPDRRGSDFFLVVENTRLANTLATIAGAAPTTQFDLGPLDRHNPDTQEFRGQMQWLTMGALAGIGLVALSLATTAIGETTERSVRLRSLRLLGAGRWELGMAHTWSTAVPLVLLGWTATALGWFVAAAMQNFDDRADLDAAWIGRALLVSVLVAGLVALTTWPGVTKTAAGSGGLTG